MFIACLKQRFLHSAHVQSMADIDSDTDKEVQARVRRHIQVMSGLIRLPAGLFNTSLGVISDSCLGFLLLPSF